MMDTRRPAANDVADGPAFTLTRAELEALVARALADALKNGVAVPVLVDKQDLARRLNVTAAHIDHLRGRGLPWIPVGKLVRFEPAKVMEWLKEHGAA